MNVIKILTSEFHGEYKDYFTKTQLESYLGNIGGLKENFKSSTGVHIELSKIRISGQKDGPSENEFVYERAFYPGINTLISDNLKGKSTILKCIKFALTGKNSLQPNMSKWISLILLEFKLGNMDYLVEVDDSGTRVKATLWRATLADYDTGDIQDVNVKYRAKTLVEFERCSEAFFYEQLGISSLKWTQKASQKNVNELYESRTSWKTFYKTIYLESKDTTSLIFGAQEKLLMQILLGLKLTIPMNRLKIVKDFLEFNSSTSSEDSASESTEPLMAEIVAALETAEDALRIASEDSSDQQLRSLLEQKAVLVEQIQVQELEKLALLKSSYKQHEKEQSLRRNLAEHSSEAKKVAQARLASEKKRSQIREHIEIGSFFSNLDLKCCPSCNNNLIEKQVAQVDQNSCGLCDHRIGETDRKEDVSRLEKKIALLDEEVNKLDLQLQVIRSAETKATTALDEHINSKNENNVSKIDAEIEFLNSSMGGLVDEISEITSNTDEKIKSIKSLESEVAVLRYRQSQAENQKDESDSEEKDEELTTKKIQLLSACIVHLRELRGRENILIIEKLRELILQVMSLIGLDSFSDVIINSEFKMSYIKDGETIGFDDITEGEQLRAKVAMYLALVLLNSEHGVGNHPRLLMIDSPGKEEADDTYFDGLTHSLKNIENEYADKIQIIIGTADRRLENLVPDRKQEVKGPKEAFF